MIFYTNFEFVLEGKKVEPEDLEDILLDVMVREFYVNLEDSSEREIARLLFDLFRECIRGDSTILNQLRKKAAARMSNKDVVAQSQGVVEVEEVDYCLADEEFQDEMDQDDDEEDCSDMEE